MYAVSTDTQLFLSSFEVNSNFCLTSREKPTNYTAITAHHNPLINEPMSDVEAAHVDTLPHLRTSHVSGCYGETPEFQHIMYSSRVEILPGEQECHWVYHKNHLVPSLANGFLF